MFKDSEIMEEVWRRRLEEQDERNRQVNIADQAETSSTTAALPVATPKCTNK